MGAFPAVSPSCVSPVLVLFAGPCGENRHTFATPEEDSHTTFVDPDSIVRSVVGRHIRTMYPLRYQRLNKGCVVTSTPMPSPIVEMPFARTSLVGRIAECATARRFLLDDAVPIVTITGPGGVG